MFPDQAEQEILQPIFHALADPVRRYLLGLLRVGGTSAGDLAASAAFRFDISHSRVSQHLRVLADAGLVDVQADGQQRFYSIKPGPMRFAARALRALESPL